jgi:hypothetical protein
MHRILSIHFPFPFPIPVAFANCDWDYYVETGFYSLKGIGYGSLSMHNAIMQMILYALPHFPIFLTF